MWPLEARSSHLVRIGRHAVEHWQRAPSGWTLSSTQVVQAPLPETMDNALADALLALFAAERPLQPVDVLLESCWLPVMLIETGRQITSAADVEALFRHRLATLYADDADPVDRWTLRCLHRAGDAQALGYGLSRQRMQMIQQAANTAGVRCRSIRPALDWGLERLGAHRSAPRHWVLWPEQDRALLAFRHRRQVVVLNPAVRWPQNPEALALLLQHECARQGFSEAQVPVAVAQWGDPSRLIKWSSDVAAPSPATGDAPHVFTPQARLPA